MYTTNVRFEDDLGERLVAFSQESGIPRNTIIKRALEAFLAANAVKVRPSKKVSKRAS